MRSCSSLEGKMHSGGAAVCHTGLVCWGGIDAQITLAGLISAVPIDSLLAQKIKGQ